MRHKEQGSAMIETAVILSLLMTILLGLVGLGRYLLAYNFVSYAAREATRYAQVHGASSKAPATGPQIESYVKTLAMGVNPVDIHVSSRWIPDNQPGGVVKVEVAVGDLKGASEVKILR